MSSAKDKMLKYLQSHVGKVVSNDKLRDIAVISDWARSIRSARQEGWDIQSVENKGYILRSLTKQEGNKRAPIDRKMRFAVLNRDNYTCQTCGRKPSDGVKFEIDHKIPVEWGGKTEIDNLQTLCEDCNQGKKHYFSEMDSTIMKEIVKEESGYSKLKLLFKLKPNYDFPVYFLQAISQIRDWERTVRLIREKEKMNIKALQKEDGWYYRNNSI